VGLVNEALLEAMKGRFKIDQFKQMLFEKISIKSLENEKQDTKKSALMKKIVEEMRSQDWARRAVNH